MGTKVEVRTIPLHGLFIHSKQVWRSLGKLRAESHSTTAQKVFMNEHDTEVSTENADFIDGLKVTPYDGELPKISKNVRVCHKSMAHPLLCYLLYNPRSIVAYSKKGII